MQLSYHNLNIMFTMEHINFYPLHIAYERFLRSIPYHSHGDSSYEIHYIPYGRGKVKINNVTYQIVPNTLYITGSHVVHEQIPDKEDPMIEYCVYLRTETKSLDKRTLIKGSYLNIFENTTFWFGQDSQNIHLLMQQLFLELENKNTGYTKQIELLLQQLVICLIRNYENKPQVNSQIAFQDLSYSKFFIIEEYFLYEYSSLSLEELSSRLGLSTRQTERLLKKHYGKTFLRKKTESRMSAAAILLMDTSKSITDVALILGYSSVEHFSNAFKKYYNQSASEYRKYNLNK